MAAGKYRTAEQVDSQGLRRLRDREMEALRKEINVGLEEIDRREVIEINDEKAHEALLEDIRSRGRQRLSAGHPPL